MGGWVVQTSKQTNKKHGVVEKHGWVVVTPKKYIHIFLSITNEIMWKNVKYNLLIKNNIYKTDNIEYVQLPILVHITRRYIFIT